MRVPFQGLPDRLLDRRAVSLQERHRLGFLLLEHQLHAELPLCGRRDGIDVEVALGVIDRDDAHVVGFVNCARADGIHITGLFEGLQRALTRRAAYLGHVHAPPLRERIGPGLVVAVHATVAALRWAIPRGSG